VPAQETKVNPNHCDGLAAVSPSTRREFLKTVAAAGAGAGIMVRTWNAFGAQKTRPASRKAGRIDVHHHMEPPFYVALRGGRSSWTPPQSVEEMDKYGIATALVSTRLPIVNDPLTNGSADSPGVARRIIEYAAEMMRDHRGRFGLFAALPWPNQDGTLREIAYAFDTLKADGIGLWTSYDDKWLGDPAFAPGYEELNRRNAVVYVHPTTAKCCRGLIPGVGDGMLEVDFDTARAVASLLANGIVSRFPNIRFIFSHSGGTLPVLSGRIADSFPKDRAALLPKGLPFELKKLYYEVAHATYAPPLSALMKLAPTSQILFGTDWPAQPMERTIGPLSQAGLSAHTLHAINRGNSERLFPRLKS
jgi:predicted TIM-barrel fold metal-dependent hydrolase